MKMHNINKELIFIRYYRYRTLYSIIEFLNYFPKRRFIMTHLKIIIYVIPKNFCVSLSLYKNDL